MDEFDAINSPKHYLAHGGIEPFDFIHSNRLGYAVGNVIKYVVRYEEKNGLEDLEKARWFLERLISEFNQK